MIYILGYIGVKHCFIPVNAGYVGFGLYTKVKNPELYE